MSQRQSHLDFPLPPELLYEILLLLPFESILACKRVSKKWKNIINDPNFHKKYHHRGSLIVTTDQKNLLCILLRPNNNNRFPSHTLHRLPITLNCNPYGLRKEHLLGLSNGIVCAQASNGYIHLYNLFTGVSHAVEKAPQNVHQIHQGFGYDRFDDDYKIMAVSKSNSYLFWLYSFNSGTWKKYDGLPPTCYEFIRRSGSYLLNGVLHSISLDKDSAGMCIPVSISTCDMHTCRFGDLPVPDSYLANKYSSCFFTEVNGRLCFLHTSKAEVYMEVYGDDGRWVRWATVKYPHAMIMGLFYLLLHTELCDLGDGRKVVLFVFWPRVIFWYDLVTKESKSLYLAEDKGGREDDTPVV
ncbi:uncharacterized protein [Phyllobates terribilis]|uniref:uncharacterized protein n=1 Tax=Phyllobates terribilis TaxID=111132 RepID=UPI003CCAB081